MRGHCDQVAFRLSGGADDPLVRLAVFEVDQLVVNTGRDRDFCRFGQDTRGPLLDVLSVGAE